MSRPRLFSGLFETDLVKSVAATLAHMRMVLVAAKLAIIPATRALLAFGLLDSNGNLIGDLILDAGDNAKFLELLVGARQAPLAGQKQPQLPLGSC